VDVSLKLSAHAVTHNYSEPHANHSKGSNGSDTCFSNKVGVFHKRRHTLTGGWGHQMCDRL